MRGLPEGDDPADSGLSRYKGVQLGGGEEGVLDGVRGESAGGFDEGFDLGDGTPWL